MRQQITVPAGTYTLSTHAKTSGSISGAQVSVTDASGNTRTLNIPSSSGWTRRELSGIQLSAGTATVAVRTSNGVLTVDGLALVRTSTPPPTTPPPTTPPPTTPPVTTTPPTGSASCSVAYVLSGQWQGGFQADVTIRNTGGSPVNGWSLRWTFANGQQVSQGWNATFSQSGSAVTATNATYNANIAPGGTVNFGFIGSMTGSTNSIPTSFTVNGDACSVT